MLTPSEKALSQEFLKLVEDWNLRLQKAEDLKGLHKVAAQLEATIKACAAFDRLKSRDLGKPGYDVSISQLKQVIESEEANRMTLNEFRALVVGAFYDAGLRAPIYGEMDEPKHHARLLAANYEMEVRESRSLIDIELVDRKAQAIDRSLRRFKNSLKGRQVLSVHWDRETVDVVDAIDAYFHLHPARPGRPKNPG